MQRERKLIVAASVFVIAIVSVAYFAVEAQENQSRIAHSNGRGSVRVGDEEFKLTSVIVKLISDGNAEVTLVSDITFFLTAAWSNSAQSPNEVDLTIAEGSRGGVDGSGKVVLADDGKGVVRLNLKGVSRNTKRSVEVTFEGK